MRWRALFLCSAVLALAVTPAHATPQQDYLDIYLKLNDSERLEKNGDFRGALEGFEDCAAKLHKLHLTYPEWERVLVNSRMEDCRAKIAELQAKADYTVGPAPETATATPETGSPPATGDESTLRARLHEVEQDLAATRRELADVQEKYKNSQLEVTSLRTQLDGVNQQLAALKSSQTVDQSMGKLLADNKTLTDRLTSAQSQIKALTSNPRSAVAKLTAQLKTMQEKLDASAAANVAMTQTTATLQQQLSQAQDDLSRANQKLAAAGPGSPDYLTIKRENEVMRGILLRELQEQSRRDGAKRLAQEEFDRLKITSKVLQEQLDILGSPMTPASNDEERQLLASLRASPSEVAPLIEEGNHISTTGGTPVDTNAPGVTPPAGTNSVATTTAPAATNTVASASPSTPVPSTMPATDTNVGASTPPAPASIPTTTDTNSVAANSPATNSAGTANSMASTTNAAPETNTASAVPAPTTPAPAPSSVAMDTNAAPATNAAPVAIDTNAAPTTPPAAGPSVASTDTNAAPATTTETPATSTNTASADNAAGTATTDNRQPDPARYSNKPRLPDDMREVAQQATDLFKMQKYDEAAAKYQTIIDKYPESLYAWSNLGVVRSQEGKLQEAMTALQQAVKLSPNDAFSYRNLGIVYYQLNQNDAAIDALERSIALDPNNVYSHDYLGCACSQKGWQEVAEKEFRKAIEINDEFPDAHYNLAIVYAMQKPPSLELARRHYKRALELGLPKDPRLEKLLGLQADGMTSR